MLRAAVYARFSTEHQSERSVDDQIVLCRSYADNHGMQVVAVYSDKAKSGASFMGRDGLLSLISDAGEQKFDVIIVEALDRVSRDMEDLAGFHKRMSFRGIQIRAVHDGEVNTVLVGLRGLVGQMFREDNAHKVRRGLSGRVKSGLSAGGQGYGYRADPVKKGGMLIVPEEAEVVVHIFEKYAAGVSPRAIAYELNERGVPGPRVGQWNASTLNGSGARGYGILRNPLYDGRLVWNRVRMIKDPDTGKRVSRDNPVDNWETTEKPELRIVPAELFEKVQGMLTGRKNQTLNQNHRPKRILSGLLRCAACGSGMSVNGSDRSGRTRIRCTAHAENGTCPNPKTFYLDTVEKLVLDSLQSELRHPEVLTAYVQEYHAERKRLRADHDKRKAKTEQRLAEVMRRIKYLVRGYTDGLFGAEIKDEMAELRASKEHCESELASLSEPENMVALHPAALKHYEAQLKSLHAAVDQAISGGLTGALQSLREVVSHVVVAPHPEGKEGGVSVEIVGDLSKMLGIAHKPLLGTASQASNPPVGGVVGSGRGT